MVVDINLDNEIMSIALEQAKKAAAIGEVPVGAVILDTNNEILATGFNQTITSNDPTAHAEIVALRTAAALAHNHRLVGSKVYITLEPCLMCLGAMFHARLAEIVFAASDPKTGACGGLVDISMYTGLNHHAVIRSGVLADQSAQLLKDFFRQRR